ncbi:very short patch repair endonuclease [Halobacillus sp. A5]|uniref:very short patch repair endonuclease n=1 Tax=Halobacillus sp. A5 TaxID=2880263 RepID=UPI0020A68CAC|nr:very short patch repair endonuclease [Halobacillus sp. A5]MCP3027014.1 very short patch repair endonuclease [Halobacillus sp. A5]
MADNLTKSQRVKNMKAIRSRSKLEDRITKALWRRGLRFRKNQRDLIGKPDISLKQYKIAIFIDSCFFHGCPLHGNMPKTNQDYWKKKLNRNKMRDKEVTNYYIENEWNIMRLWEHEFKTNFDAAIDKIEHFINEAKLE